jgi:hypothetical protein
LCWVYYKRDTDSSTRKETVKNILRYERSL